MICTPQQNIVVNRCLASRLVIKYYWDHHVTGHVTGGSCGTMGIRYMLFVEIPGKETTGNPKCKLEDNIKMNFKEM